MLVLVTYDVATGDAQGRKRLRQVAKKCQNYGQRVQNSVFECVVNQTEFLQLKYELQALIDEKQDSLRFYHLGNNHKNKVEHLGAKPSFDVEGPLVF